HHRGDGAGGRAPPDGHHREPGGEDRLLHGARQREVAPPGHAGRPDPLRGGGDADPRSHGPDEGDRHRGRPGGRRGRDDGARGGSLMPMSVAPQPSGSLVHPTALVDETAELAHDVVVGPYSIVGPGVTIAEGTRIGPHVLVERDTSIGARCVVHKGAVLGTDPQDLKYAGEATRLLIGDETVIREYATLNRGTTALGYTAVGSGCLLMAYTHV